jgi:Na+/H+ antiporter NhaD/arsenite permease-like protein
MPEMPLWSVVPFGLLLIAVAVFPLVAGRWWHSNWSKAIVSTAFGLPVAMFVYRRAPDALAHAGLEYLGFVSLLGSLYVVSGSIRLAGRLAGTPTANVLLLGFGAVLANLIGTTGASMLLIRPFLRANESRSSRVHLVVFFILIVSNCGGCLTPLGDPPLFLGFLKGVPFTWTLGLWKPWAVVVGGLLSVFVIWDRIRLQREGPAPPAAPEPLRLEGARNLALLAAIIGVVLANGFWVHPRFGATAAELFQCGALFAIAVVSMGITPLRIRTANGFSWHPYIEVVVLFAGIFAAMVPALAVLQTRGASLGVSEPWQYFLATGLLSAFLDNAPTYLAFLSMAQFLPAEVAGTTQPVLAAISLGAVFFGALTYIGNGPNFMVKAIAEDSGIRMPSFFGFLGWSLPVLGPILLAVGLIFFR